MLFNINVSFQNLSEARIAKAAVRRASALRFMLKMRVQNRPHAHSPRFASIDPALTIHNAAMHLTRRRFVTIVTLKLVDSYRKKFLLYAMSFHAGKLSVVTDLVRIYIIFTNVLEKNEVLINILLKIIRPARHS